MIYYIIRKKIVFDGEHISDQIVTITKSKKIAKDFCERIPNTYYEKVKTGEHKNEQIN